MTIQQLESKLGITLPPAEGEEKTRYLCEITNCPFSNSLVWSDEDFPNLLKNIQAFDCINPEEEVVITVRPVKLSHGQCRLLHEYFHDASLIG